MAGWWNYVSRGSMGAKHRARLPNVIVWYMYIKKFYIRSTDDEFFFPSPLSLNMCMRITRHHCPIRHLVVTGWVWRLSAGTCTCGIFPPSSFFKDVCTARDSVRVAQLVHPPFFPKDGK